MTVDELIEAVAARVTTTDLRLDSKLHAQMALDFNQTRAEREYHEARARELTPFHVEPGAPCPFCCKKPTRLAWTWEHLSQCYAKTKPPTHSPHLGHATTNDPSQTVSQAVQPPFTQNGPFTAQ